MTQAIPVFTPSENGLGADYRAIYRSELVAWGSFKANFEKDYVKVAGTMMVHGKKVIKPLKLASALRSQKGDTYEFLKKYIFGEEDIKKIRKDYMDNTDAIKQLTLEYAVRMTMKKEDMKFQLKKITNEMFTKITQIRIDYAGVRYDPAHFTKTQRVPITFHGTSHSLGLLDNTFYPDGDLKEKKDWINIEDANKDITKQIAEPERKSRHTIMSFWNGAHNVTGSFTYAEQRMIQSLILNHFYKFPNVAKTSLERDIKHGLHTPAMKEVISREVYNVANTDVTGLIGYYPSYVNMVKEGKEYVPKPRETYTRWFWIAINFTTGPKLLKDTAGLIYAPEQTKNGDAGNKDDNLYRKAYFVIDKLKMALPQNYGYFVSRFMHIRIEKKKKNFFLRIAYGLMKVVLSLVSAATEVFMKIPVLKQLTEVVIKWMIGKFNLTYNAARNALKNILSAIFLSIITFSVGALASGTVEALSLTNLTSFNSVSEMAMQVSGAIEEVGKGELASEEERNQNEMTEMNKELDKLEELEANTFAGTLGGTSSQEDMDEMMYNGMFNIPNNTPTMPKE